MAEKKKPMSLNDRHQRFLKDFSSSHNRSSRPPPPPPSNLQTEEEKPQHQPEKMKLEGRRRLFKFSSENDQNEEPNFSGIMDFDDSPPLKKDNHHVSVDPPNFSGILDFDSPDMKVRDSVDDLSSKIELVLDKGESVDQLGGDGKEYDSAGSSFSLSPDRPDGELSAKTRVESANYEAEGDRFVDCVDSSSSPEEEKSPNEKIEERQCLSKKEDNYEPYFSEVTEGKSLPTKVVDILDNLSHKVGYLSQKKKTDNKVEMISVSSPSITEEESLNQLGRDAATDVNQKHNYDGFAVSISSNSSNVLSDLETKSRAHSETIEGESDRSVDGVISSNPSEEERLQPQKVKLEGRRRLCKVSSNDVDNSVPLDGPSFSAITDLDSPPSNIRDILNDLSSRMDYLSIDKKKVGKVERVSDSSLSITKEEPPNLFEGYGEGDTKQKYSNAYSLSPFPSDLLTNLDTKFKLHNAKTEVEGDRRVNCVDKVQMVDKSQRKDKNIKKIEKSVSKRSVLVGDDDEDPYLILSNAQSTKKIPNRDSEVKDHVEDCISVDASMDTGGDWVFEDGESIILSGKPSNYILPGKIAKILYPHQRNGLRWLWSLHCMGTGGILGDDMGLGKTMQICSFLAGLFHSGLIKRVMVVAPKTLLTHWIKELKVVGLSEKIREYFGTCAKLRQYELEYILQGTGILLTTYDIVRNNFKSLRGDSFFLDERTEDTITWDYTILDEGHIIKNPSTQRAKSLLEIPSGHRIIISGTPIQNNLKELWALFSFCCPALLGDKKEFKVRYEAAILRGNEKNATEREKRIGSTVAKELRDRIEPYFLRRLKSEVFVDGEATNSSKLSKKNEMIVWLRLTQCQRQLYEAFLNSELVLSSFDGSPLAALTVLKKICDHPYLLTKRAAEDVLEGMETMLNQDDLGILEKMALHLANATNSENFQNLIDNVSCKITFILSLLDNLIPEGHNVLIFSQTRKMLNFVQEAIISRGYKFLRIDGTTKISDREKIVNDFQEGKGAPIFLLTSQVGGLGLTLTKADRVIVVDPAWNPSTDNQSVDRAYRIGQTKDVLVYRLMTCGTIEEKIYRMQVFKGGLFKSATEHKEQTRYFSQHDLRELFSLPKEGFDVSVTQRQLDEEHDQHHIMNDSLKEHVEFLKSHGIAGVSHHSLLFSKTAPVSVVQISDEVPRKKETIYVGSSPSSSSVERSVDGSEYAFNPKDVRPSKKSNAVVTPNKLTESEIRDKLERLRQAYENKAMMSKLPDRGERLKRQIANLNMELEKMNVAESSEAEIIDLDDISGKLERIYV